MIQYKVWTNSDLFKRVTVLDVGCGTGIVSLFATRAGAARVFAVDPSDTAEKAEQVLQNVVTFMSYQNPARLYTNPTCITAIRCKAEETKLLQDVTHVDIIVSERMGYALLYESVVLEPKPGGVMSPGQYQMGFAL